MYKLILRPRAEKHFAKLPQKLKIKIYKALKKLELDPFQKGLDIKKLANTKKSYRLRIGEIRIIYELNTKLKDIFIVDIDFRRTNTY